VAPGVRHERRVVRSVVHLIAHLSAHSAARRVDPPTRDDRDARRVHCHHFVQNDEGHAQFLLRDRRDPSVHELDPTRTAGPRTNRVRATLVVPTRSSDQFVVPHHRGGHGDLRARAAFPCDRALRRSATWKNWCVDPSNCREQVLGLTLP